MNNKEEGIRQAAYKETLEASTQEKVLSENETAALGKLTARYGEEEGTLVFTQVMVEAEADSILKAESYLYNTGIEKHKKVIGDLGEKAKRLSQEFMSKRDAIMNRNEFTDEAKAHRLNDLYDEYLPKMNAIESEQWDVDRKHQVDRKETAKTALEKINAKASINDLDAKDMTYITYMLAHGDNDDILGVLKEYKFHPYLLKMVNARDKKKAPQHNYKGQPIYNRLSVNHPLQAIADAPFYPLGGITTYIGEATFSNQARDLIPAAGIPKVDPFAFINLKGPQRDKDLTVDPWGLPVRKQAGSHRIPTI
jgi:hypothetical protein